MALWGWRELIVIFQLLKGIQQIVLVNFIA
jgi:hypothetical protein